MNINRNYISTQNTYANNNPQYIVVHNTDNFSAGANALAHAKAQHDGNFSGMSAHYYVDDGGTAYQATEHRLGTWHVGKNYGGGRFFGTVSNRNSIGIEMCVQKGYDYEKAFQNTVALVRHLMAQTGIPADRVLQHYDVCAKNCPSQIRKRGDWNRFKSLISGSQTSKPVQPASTTSKTTGNTVVRDGQIHSNNFCNAGLATDGIRGSATAKGGIKALQQAANMDYGAGLKVDGIWGPKSDAALKGHTVRLGEKQYMVTALEILLMLKGYNPNGVENPGNFGAGCEAAVRQYQSAHGLTVDGIAGYNTFKSLIS